MTIEKKLENKVMTMNVQGRLDTTTAPELERELLPAIDEAKELVLDFNTLEYLSSAGLRVLLAGQKKVTAQKKSMTLRNVNESIMEVFEMTGFADILTLA